jgi:hypothetical protein
LILDELVLPATPQQLVVFLVAGEENPREEGFASVPSENQAGLLALMAGIAWDSQHELVFFTVVAAKNKKSGWQLLHGVTARFQRGISY